MTFGDLRRKPNLLIIITDQEREVMHWPEGWAEANLPARTTLPGDVFSPMTGRTIELVFPWGPERHEPPVPLQATVSDPGSPNGTDPTTAEVELDVLEGGAGEDDERRDDDTV